MDGKETSAGLSKRITETWMDVKLGKKKMSEYLQAVKDWQKAVEEDAQEWREFEAK